MITANKPHISVKTSTKAPKHRSWLFVVFEFLLLAVVAIFLLEGLFRICGVGGQEFLEPDAQLGCHQVANKQVTWRLEGYSDDRMSSTGRRDVEHTLAKPVGITRIAVLGDSATEGLQVPLNDTYCRVLNQLLNGNSKPKYEVLNFGCSSYSTGQQVLQFEKQVINYHPDITVLLYVRGAALQNVYNPYKRAAEPRPYFYLSKNSVSAGGTPAPPGKTVVSTSQNKFHNVITAKLPGSKTPASSSVGPSARLDASVRLQEDDSILREQIVNMQPNAVLDFLRKHSRIYGVFSQANLSLSIHEKLYNKIRGWINSLLSHANSDQHNISQSRIFYPPQDVWTVTKALLIRLNQDCKTAHNKLIVMAFPNTVNDPALAKQIPDLQKLSQQEGFSFLDLTPAFKANSDPNSLFLLYHFSSAGHRLTAQQLKQHLLEQY